MYVKVSIAQMQNIKKKELVKSLIVYRASKILT